MISFGAIESRKIKQLLRKKIRCVLVRQGLTNQGKSVLFNYTPKTNFVGADETKLLLVKEEHEHHNHKQRYHHPNPLKLLKA